MASLIDVSNAVVTAIAGVLYPDGTGQPSAITNACKVYMGWPAPAQLDADMANGVVNVSVWPRPGDERVVETSDPRWQTAIDPDPTLVMNIQNQWIGITGTPSVPQVVSATIQNTPYPYEVQEGDTLAGVRSGLLAVIQADYPTAFIEAGYIKLPSSANLQAVRVGAAGTVVRELSRQERGLQITVWAPTPAIREAAGNLLDVSLKRMKLLDMADNTVAKFYYAGSSISDEHEKTRIYRYDFIFRAEYSTVETEEHMQVVNPVVSTQVTTEIT